MTATLESTPTWIFPTADAAGYYRWTLPPADVAALARQASTALTPKERVAFLGNTASLFRSGRMNADVYLDVLSRFANDANPQVVDALIEPLGHLRATFDAPETRSAFAAYTRRILRPALDRIGFTPRPGEAPTVTVLRPRLIGWLVDEGKDEEVLRFAEEQARKYLADPKSVDPTLIRVVLSAAALQGDQALFEDFRRRFETASTPAERSYFLAALGSFEKPDVRAKALDYALSGQVRVQEMFAITNVGQFATDEERQRSFDWATSHYEAYTAKLPRGFGTFTSIAGGCDEKRLEAARKFLTDEKRRQDGTERAMARVTESVRECTALRSREMERVVSYLKR
jgi:alanyl aminopeptidase